MHIRKAEKKSRSCYVNGIHIHFVHSREFEIQWRQRLGEKWQIYSHIWKRDRNQKCIKSLRMEYNNSTQCSIFFMDFMLGENYPSTINRNHFQFDKNVFQLETPFGRERLFMRQKEILGLVRKWRCSWERRNFMLCTQWTYILTLHWQPSDILYFSN